MRVQGDHARHSVKRLPFNTKPASLVGRPHTDIRASTGFPHRRQREIASQMALRPTAPGQLAEMAFQSGFGGLTWRNGSSAERRRGIPPATFSRTARRPPATVASLASFESPTLMPQVKRKSHD